MRRTNIAVRAIFINEISHLVGNTHGENGAPDRIRTCGLCLRRATLYPAELRVRRALVKAHQAVWVIQVLRRAGKGF